jgi:hypothetical protein
MQHKCSFPCMKWLEYLMVCLYDTPYTKKHFDAPVEYLGWALEVVRLACCFSLQFIKARPILKKYTIGMKMLQHTSYHKCDVPKGRSLQLTKFTFLFAKLCQGICCLLDVRNEVSVWTSCFWADLLERERSWLCLDFNCRLAKYFW